MLIGKRKDGIVSLDDGCCVYMVTFSSTIRQSGERETDEAVKTRIWGKGGLIKLHASFPRRGDLFPISMQRDLHRLPACNFGVDVEKTGNSTTWKQGQRG